ASDATLVDWVVDESAPPVGSLGYITRSALRAPLQAGQIHALAGADAVWTVHVAAIGGVDPLVAPARAVVPLGDAPQRVALLDDIPAERLDLRPGCLAAAGSRLLPVGPALGAGLGSDAGTLAAPLGPRYRG